MTVLVRLSKLRHPFLVNRWKLCRDLKKYKSECSNNTRKYNYYWTKTDDFNEDLLYIYMYFSGFDKKYTFTLSKKTCTIEFSSREKGTFYVPTRKMFIDNCPYEMLESMLFQQSLLGSVGMLTAQEMNMLIQLRDLYFEEPQ